MKSVETSNPICSRLRFSWSPPTSVCSPITHYQLQVQGGDRFYHDTPTLIQGTLSEYRLAVSHIRKWPFLLRDNEEVAFRIRAKNNFGWGKWSKVTNNGTRLEQCFMPAVDMSKDNNPYTKEFK